MPNDKVPSREVLAKPTTTRDKSAPPCDTKGDTKNDSDSEAKADSKDIVLMHGPTSDGNGIRVLRAREGRVEEGELRLVRQGMPIPSGEVVSLAQRHEHPLLWDVKVHFRMEANQGHAGPARVASRAYRENWDDVFVSNRADHNVDDERMLN